MGEASEDNQPTSNDTQAALSTATALDDTTTKPNSPVSAPGSVRSGEESIGQFDDGSILDDSFSGSETSDQTESSIGTTALRTIKSRSIYKAYKDKLRAKSERAEPPAGKHGASLVKSLIDYMRVLEDRIDSLETGSQDTIDPPETCLSKEIPGDQDFDSKTVPDVWRKKVEVAVTSKLYHAYSDSTDNPNRLFSSNYGHPSILPGTFTCSWDTQHMIRALYRTHPSIPPKDVPALDPHPDEIEVVLLSIASDPIACFFASKLEFHPTLVASQLYPGGPLVLRFGRPFKPILQHFHSLKDELKKLEQEFGASKRGGDSQSGSDLDSAPLPSHESPALEDGPFAPRNWRNPVGLTHFRLLVEFIDKYLGHEVRLYQDLRAGKAERVAFENLWMLFAAQDTIYCPSRDPGKEAYETTDGQGNEYRPVRRHTPQAYRVEATQGGLPLDWLLFHTPFPKGQEQYGASTDRFTDNPSKATILPATKTVTVRSSYSNFNVYCFYVDFNGNEFGIVRDVFIFRPYDREMDIRKLQAYPLVYATHTNLVHRGLKFMEATVVSHMQYEGLTVGMSREDIHSPVVVDMKLAFERDSSLGKQEVEVPKFDLGNVWWLGKSLPARSSDAAIIPAPSNPRCFYPRCQRAGCSSDIYIKVIEETRLSVRSQYKTLLEELETNHDGPLSCRKTLEAGDMIVLLPGAVPAFVLRNRKWVLLDLNLLKPLEKTHEWKHLVLPKGHRKMVQAMVETHTAVQTSGMKHDPRSAGMDLVRGKGRGCIILLHGVPGVGKTSTAECVAAHTSKPLYPITCGDIGYRPEDVERNMENHFKLAHKWGCVLLLDEADVFLAKRDQRDVQRNGLVSVFLRILEYYSGILFLTTNRVGSIDDAFRSRLHLTLYYPKLTKEQTTKIFKRNFKRIANVNNDRQRRGLVPFECQRSEQKAVIKWAEETWKKLRWNGRQIRNTFQTVLALAEFDARGDGSKPASPVVTKSHFKIVASASIQFNQYLKQTHGHDEDAVARREMIRADNFPMEFGDESSENDSSSSSEDSGDSDDSGTEGDSEERGSDSDHEKRKKKKSSSSKSGGKEKKGSKAKGEKSGKSGKKNRGEADGKSKGDKKTKQKKKKDEEDNSDEDESETDDSE